MISRRVGRQERWPIEFSIAYLARRAGVSRGTMRRRLRAIPAMLKVLQSAPAGTRPRLTLDDLKALNPRVFDSIMLREAMSGGESLAESDEDEAA